MVQQTFRNKNIYRDFDLSFSSNPLTKDISKKTDANAINQSLRNLINTNFYERPFRPNVGSNIRALLFEPADPITISNLRNMIQQTIVNYEPRVLLDYVYVTDNLDRNAYSVKIQYRINISEDPIEYTVTLKRLR